MPYEEKADSSDEQQPGKIKVVCHSCGARYQVRDSKVRGKRFRATCKRCGGIIVARCTNAFTLAPENAAAGEGVLPATQNLHHEDLQQEEEASWYVVMSGKPHGPLTPSDVRKLFDNRRINDRTYLWRAGDQEWRRLIEVDDFHDLFGEGPTSFYGAPPAGAALPEFGVGEEEPTTVDDREELAQRAKAMFGSQLDDYQDDGSYDQSTGYHIPEAEEAATRMVHRGTQGQQALAPQPSYLPLPPVPRRRAVLPAPTGVPRRPELVRGSPSVPDAGGLSPLAEQASPNPPPAWPLPRSSGPSPQIASPAAAPPQATLPGAMAQTAWAPPPLLTPSLGPGAGLTAGMPQVAPAPSLSAQPFGAPEPQPIAALAPPPAEPFATPPAGVAASQVPLPVAPTAPAVPVAPGLKATGSSAVLATRPMLRSLGFWTTGKTAAVAAIAGGLAVAGTVVLVVVLVRPRHRPVRETQPVAAESKVEIKVRQPPAPQAATPRLAKSKSNSKAKSITKAPAAEPPAVAEAEAAPRPVRKPRAAPAPAAEEEESSPRPRPKQAKAAARPAAKPAKKNVLSMRGGAELSEADALLAEAAKKSPPKAAKKQPPGPPKVDVDDILAAGGGASGGGGGKGAAGARGAGAQPKPIAKARKKAPEANADDILSAGGATKRQPAALPVQPPRKLIEQGMNAIFFRVQSCYQRYQQPGKVEVVVNLRGDGTHDQQVVGTFAGTPTGSCVLAAVARARLPRFSGPPTSFRWPYTLR